MEPGTGESAHLSNDEWFAQNYLELVQKYPRRWIAVVEREVIAEAATRAGAEAEGRRLAPDKEVSLYFVEPTALPL